jgi:hypothetical protein
MDRREKAPFTFCGIKPTGGKRGSVLSVNRQWATLRSGDYSIVGHEEKVSIERKSLDDLYSTLAGDRERFEREHERLAECEFAAVVIEAPWPVILGGSSRSRLNPSSIWHTALSWSVRYRVQWWALEDRRTAEIGTFRLLEAWWHKWSKSQKASAPTTGSELQPDSNTGQPISTGPARSSRSRGSGRT